MTVYSKRFVVHSTCIAFFHVIPNPGFFSSVIPNPGFFSSVIPNPGFFSSVIPNPGFIGVRDLFFTHDQQQIPPRLRRVRNDMRLVGMPLDTRL
jgi:hypothetical protein